MNQEVYAAFIDFEKAFDKVRHDKLKQLLLSRNLDLRDVRIVCNLYWGQTANVRVKNDLTEEVQIRRGVRQEYILSPLLFNYYSEAIFAEALENESRGIVVNGKVINNIRYADDTVMLASNPEDIQHLLQRLVMCCENYGLKINTRKTKLMIVSKSLSSQTQVNIVINNDTVETVQTYKYLGAWLDRSGDVTREIRARIEIARAAFLKLRKFFTSRNICKELKMRMLRCYVFSTLLYGAEAWTLKRCHLKNLEAFEMWCYRRVWRISWTERVTNEEVLRRMGVSCEIVNTIKRRKLEYLGHIMRGPKYALLQLIVQGKISGKRSIGRRRASWLKNLRDWFGCSNVQLFRAAVNRVRIAMMITNLR